MKKVHGGVETIIAAVILVGIVIALIIGAIIPVGTATKDTAKASVDKLTDVQETIKN